MPKNTGIGGNKRKKGKKLGGEERDLTFKTEMQEYGQVLRLFGDARLEIQCIDGVKRVGHIRGKMKKKIWIANGDVVLVAIREYENDKCDVIGKYNEDEVRKLKKAGEIPESIKLPENENKEQTEQNDGEILFEDGTNKDEEDDEKDTTSNKNAKKNVKKEQPPSDEEDEFDIEKI